MKLRWLLLLLPIRIVLLALIAFLVWQAVIFFRPRPQPLSMAELRAARAAIQTAASLLRASAPQGPMRVGVAHFINDGTDAITELVKTELARQPGVSVEAGSPLQRFLRDVSRTVSEATSMDEVFFAGRRVGLDVVVAGRVLKVESQDESQGSAMLQIFAYDCRSGTWLVRDTFEGEWRANWVERAAARVAVLSPRARFMLWIIGVLALPWSTMWGTLWALRRSSNVASFILILAYTIVDLLVGVALMGFRVIGPGAWWKFFGAMALCAGYNFWACERIAARSR